MNIKKAEWDILRLVVWSPISLFAEFMICGNIGRHMK